jgi:hypothetical protein
MVAHGLLKDAMHNNMLASSVLGSYHSVLQRGSQFTCNSTAKREAATDRAATSQDVHNAQDLGQDLWTLRVNRQASSAVGNGCME